MGAPQNSIDVKLLRQQDAAYVLGVTTSWLKDHVAEVPRNADSTYDAKTLVGWWVNKAVADALEKAGVTDDDPKIRKIKVDTALAELKYQQLAGQLVPMRLVEPFFQEVSAILKRLGEETQKQFGEMAYELYLESMEEIERVAARTIDEASEAANGEEPEGKAGSEA